MKAPGPAGDPDAAAAALPFGGRRRTEDITRQNHDRYERLVDRVEPMVNRLEETASQS